jgi:hypothetical protein
MQAEARAIEIHNYITLIVQKSMLQQHKEHFQRKAHNFGQAIIGLELLQSLYLDLLGRGWNSAASAITRQRYDILRPRPNFKDDAHSINDYESGQLSVDGSKIIESYGEGFDGEGINHHGLQHKKLSYHVAMKEKDDKKKLFYRLLAVAIVNIICILCALSISYTREWAWQQAWMIVCMMYTIQDMVLNQTSLAYIMGYVLPKRFTTQFNAAKHEAQKAVITFWKTYKETKFVHRNDIKFNVIAMEEASAVAEKSEHQIAYERAEERKKLLDYHYQSEHSKTNLPYKSSCPQQYLFVSDKLANLHPAVFESGIISSIDPEWHDLHPGVEDNGLIELEAEMIAIDKELFADTTNTTTTIEKDGEDIINTTTDVEQGDNGNIGSDEGITINNNDNLALPPVTSLPPISFQDKDIKDIREEEDESDTRPTSSTLNTMAPLTPIAPIADATVDLPSDSNQPTPPLVQEHNSITDKWVITLHRILDRGDDLDKFGKYITSRTMQLWMPLLKIGNMILHKYAKFHMSYKKLIANSILSLLGFIFGLVMFGHALPQGVPFTICAIFAYAWPGFVYSSILMYYILGLLYFSLRMLYKSISVTCLIIGYLCVQSCLYISSSALWCWFDMHKCHPYYIFVYLFYGNFVIDINKLFKWCCTGCVAFVGIFYDSSLEHYNSIKKQQQEREQLEADALKEIEERNKEELAAHPLVGLNKSEIMEILDCMMDMVNTVESIEMTEMYNEQRNASLRKQKKMLNKDDDEEAELENETEVLAPSAIINNTDIFYVATDFSDDEGHNDEKYDAVEDVKNNADEENSRVPPSFARMKREKTRAQILDEENRFKKRQIQARKSQIISAFLHLEHELSHISQKRKERLSERLDRRKAGLDPNEPSEPHQAEQSKLEIMKKKAMAADISRSHAMSMKQKDTHDSTIHRVSVKKRAKKVRKKFGGVISRISFLNKFGADLSKPVVPLTNDSTNDDDYEEVEEIVEMSAVELKKMKQKESLEIRLKQRKLQQRMAKFKFAARLAGSKGSSFTVKNKQSFLSKVENQIKLEENNEEKETETEAEATAVTVEDGEKEEASEPELNEVEDLVLEVEKETIQDISEDQEPLAIKETETETEMEKDQMQELEELVLEAEDESQQEKEVEVKVETETNAAVDEMVVVDDLEEDVEQVFEPVVEQGQEHELVVEPVEMDIVPVVAPLQEDDLVLEEDVEHLIDQAPLAEDTEVEQQELEQESQPVIGLEPQPEPIIEQEEEEQVQEQVSVVEQGQEDNLVLEENMDVHSEASVDFMTELNDLVSPEVPVIEANPPPMQTESTGDTNVNVEELEELEELDHDDHDGLYDF